ncbi:F-box domain [Macleaya cordata]|uniref:F-box domain n=1 Tax=Macleaya cordata TaxID=56857 RepID=A0A200PVK2_MACCD|nr:F-box domain [Macleaya cordata]
MAETDQQLQIVRSREKPNDQLISDDDGVVVVVVSKEMEITGRKVSKRPKKKEELRLLREPLDAFGSDIMMMIMNHLDAQGVALCLLVSHGWNEVASSDNLWARKCEELWLGKAHIPRLSPGTSMLAAYSFSVMDAKRTRIVKEDLCDHVWEFRFKKKQEAPEYWRNLDPSWKGIGPPMLRYFHPDGSQSADPDDLVWGGHECTFSTVTSFVGDGRIREHYVRINRWPPMTVSRKLDWSWELGNRLCWYSSTPDANKEGGTGPLFPVW